MRLVRILGGFVLLAVLLGVLVAGISRVQDRMNQIRRTEELTDVEPLQNAPPMVAFTTIALGGFRGLLADWLWLRSSRLQEEGSYFEMVQLASWIVKLQPRFTGAAAFLGWNMAYNISVSFGSVEDRWRWVQRGIELIRDEALVYNPGDPELLRELGWIFQHKLGQDLDDANRYYKTELALQMIKALGTYPPDWNALANSPITETALREKLGPDSKIWGILAAAGLTLDGLEKEFRQTEDWPASVKAELAKQPDLRSLELYLRNRWLRQVFKLEPDLVAKINLKYGDLDWRLPEAQAIFWATKGLQTADKEVHIGCERMIFQALSAAFRGGRLIYMKDIKRLEMTPNIAVVDAADLSYLEAMAKHPDNRSVKSAYENFLVDAVVILYTFGRKEKAQEFLDKARKGYPAARFKMNLDEFALGELAEDMVFANYNQAQGAVQAYLIQCCQALVYGDYERAAAFEGVASKLWQKYMANIGESTFKRRGLPPYPQMKRNAVAECLKGFPPDLVARLRAELQQKNSKVELPTEEPPEDPADAKAPGNQPVPEIKR